MGSIRGILLKGENEWNEWKNWINNTPKNIILKEYLIEGWLFKYGYGQTSFVNQ